MELRCGGRIHGVINTGTIEVKCRSKSCGASAKVVVMHRFDLRTGELVETLKFKNPPRIEENEDHAHRIHPPALRVP